MCDYDTLCDGVLAEYYAPVEYVNSKVIMRINGVEVNSDYVRKRGNNLLYASMDMLPPELQETYGNDEILNVEVEFCGGIDNFVNKPFEKYLSVSYIGSVPEISSWCNISLSDRENRVILPVEQVENGLDIAFSLSNLSTYQNVGIQIFQDERFLENYFLSTFNAST